MSLPHRKGYATVQAAMHSKAYATTPGAAVDTGCPCGLVHVDLPKDAPKPLRTRRDTGPDALTRQAVYKRDDWCCIRCGASVIGRPRSVHHRKLRKQGGGHEPGNLILLCGTGTAACHGWVHAHPSEARAAGWLVRGADDPAAEPVMVRLPGGRRVLMWLTGDGERVTEDPRAAGAAA